MKQEKSCGAIVIDNEKVLVVKHNAGHVSFPKGHMEKGETEKETAIREVKEETGIDIEVDTNYRYTISYSPKEGVMKDVVFFLGKATGGELKPQEKEVSEVKFIPFNEVESSLTHDDIKELFRQVLKDIKK